MDLLVRLLITICVIWLAQVLIGAFKLKEPASQILFVVVLVLAIIWLVSGTAIIHLP